MRYFRSHTKPLKIYILRLTYLSVGSIDNPVQCNSAQWQAKAVDTMQRYTKEAQQAQLFPPLQPVVQPGWETPVLGAPPELQPRSKQSWDVYECQGHQGVGDKHSQLLRANAKYNVYIEIILNIIIYPYKKGYNPRLLLPSA